MLYNNRKIRRRYFEVEIVLLRTLWVKRNVGRGTPTGIPSFFVRILTGILEKF